jgi:putative aldouronate transport system substrate-binding protein
MLKKVFCILVIGILILSLVTGCVKTPTPGGDSQTNATQSTAGGENQQGGEKSLYPITDKPLTLSYWVPMHEKATPFIKSYNENEAYIEMEKKTGIHIDFIHPATGQTKEQFGIMIASGDLPDIIGSAANYAGGEFKGVYDGAFVNLAPYLAENAPDYLRLINSDEELKREVTAEDGTIAAFYRIKLEKDPPWRRPILRKDWLDEFGLEEPKTLDDYEVMFEKIKTQKNVVPYVLVKNGMEEQFTGAFDVLPGFYLKDGTTVAFGQMEPGFKEYLTLMNKWFNAGYISKDFPSLDNAQARNLFNSEKAGMYINSVDTAYKNALELDRVHTSAPEPRQYLGQKLHTLAIDWPVTGDTTVVASTSKYIKEAIQWLNYAYTVEGSRLFNYGVEGRSWVLDENGQPVYTDYMKNALDAPSYILKVHFAPKLCDPDVKCLPALFQYEGAAEFRKMWSDDPNIDYSYRLPPIKLTKEELDRRSLIMTQVNTYSDEMVLRFIMGAEPLANFDAYVAQLKAYGIEEAIQITQNAYNRYIGQ